MKFSIKDFFSKFDQTHRKLDIWSHLLKKSSMENLIFLCCVKQDQVALLPTIIIGICVYRPESSGKPRTVT